MSVIVWIVGAQLLALMAWHRLCVVGKRGDSND